MNSKSEKISTVAVLLFFFFFHSGYQLSIFGALQGTYFWFCNLALLLGALAIYFRRKDFVLILLSVLIPTLFFWIIDHVKRSLTGTDFLGLTEALYHPGVSIFGFLIGHYHYVLVPLLLFAFFSMENRKPELFKGLLILAFSILPASFFLFPAEQNINCARSSCFDTLPTIEGKTYFALYSVVILLICYGTGLFLSRFLLPLKISARTNRALLVALLFFGVGFTALGYSRKRTVPDFSCTAPYEDGTVRVRCEFLNEHVPNWMVLHYELVNKTNAIQECESFIEFEGKKELLQDGLTVYAKTPLKVSILIHYPAKDTAIHLSASCRPL